MKAEIYLGKEKVEIKELPLRVSHLNQCEIYSIIRTPLCQPFFLHFLIFFVLPSNVLSFRVL